MTVLRSALIVAALAACGGGPAQTTTHPAPARTVAAPPAADRDVDCKERCDDVVRSRHDACGIDGTWPAWCGDSNDRMRAECEASCR